MEIKDIITALGIPVSSGIIILILSLIKIPKIELNVWGLIGKALSNALNKDVLDRLNTLEHKLDTHITESERASALTDRHRILVFSDEISDGKKHDKQHFENMLYTIDMYESYCKEHPDFPNNKCLTAIENIKTTYRDKLINGKF